MKNEELRMEIAHPNEQSEMHFSWATLKVLLSSCK